MKLISSGLADLAIVALLAAPAAAAQPSTSPLKFEVASVKVATSGINGYQGGCHGIDFSPRLRPNETEVPLGRCVITDARLSHLISMAFDVPLQNLSTGPDWIQRGDLRFDVNAEAEDPRKTTQAQLLTMMQNLLVERFHLKFHYQNSTANGFAFTVAKNGPKLRQSTSDQPKIRFTALNGETVLKPTSRAISLTAQKWSMADLANLLTAAGESGPAVDKTGLAGDYDFTLAWDNDAGPALSTALREQLGLQMKPEKVPVSTFVVDAAEKPAAN